ncbi:small GTP-binding protein [Histomonas meleagridis]|uniref:small GTP-binding protein n=1 Tax=Histomonas meleagridis TaxID=135588 RepID=UPI00355A5043|nr:small GTP-binding protein [Histomonas meleagridis]KAH0805236.1 small GTP-binding protein [Histomonas meleagridis]
MDNKTRPNIKLVFIGDSSVGKSSLVVKYCTKAFPFEIQPTINAAYQTKIFQLADGTEIELRIWDTAGQEAYHSLAPIYFQNASIAFVVFDITSRSTFKNVEEWIKLVRDYGNKGMMVVIVANKADLESDRQIQPKEYNDLADKCGALVQETSALTGVGIEEMFDLAVNKLVEADEALQYQLYVSKNQVKQEQMKNSRCC